MKSSIQILVFLLIQLLISYIKRHLSSSIIWLHWHIFHRGKSMMNAWFYLVFRIIGLFSTFLQMWSIRCCWSWLFFILFCVLLLLFWGVLDWKCFNTFQYLFLFSTCPIFNKREPLQTSSWTPLLRFQQPDSLLSVLMRHCRLIMCVLLRPGAAPVPRSPGSFW